MHTHSGDCGCGDSYVNGRFSQNWLALNSCGCANYKNGTEKMLGFQEITHGEKYSFFIASNTIKNPKPLHSPLFCVFPLYPTFIFLSQWSNSRFCLIVQTPKCIRSWRSISAGSEACKYSNNSSYIFKKWAQWFM